MKRLFGSIILMLCLPACDEEKPPEGVVLIFDDLGVGDALPDEGLADASICAPETPRLNCPLAWQDGALCKVTADRCAPGERPSLVDGCKAVGPECALMHMQDGRCMPDPVACPDNAVVHLTDGCVPVGPECATNGCDAPACPDGEWWIPSQGCVDLRRKNCAAPLPDAVHVRIDADPADASGTEDKPFPSVADALMAAEEGDQIFIWPGRYEGQLALVQRQLTLTGSCDGPVVLSADGSLSFISGGAVRFENLRLESGVDTVTVVQGGQLTVQSTEIVGDVPLLASGDGVHVELTDVGVSGLGPAQPVNFGRGILAQDGGHVTAARLAMREASLIGAHALQPNSRISLFDASISRTHAPEGEFATGVVAHGEAAVELDGVVIDQTAGYGIRVAGAGQVTLTNSQIQATLPPPDNSFPGVGLQVETGGNIGVTKSRIKETEGIAIRSSAGQIEAAFVRVENSISRDGLHPHPLLGIAWEANLAADLLAYEGGSIVFEDGTLLNTEGSAVHALGGQAQVTRTFIAGQHAPQLVNSEMESFSAGAVALVGDAAELQVLQSAMRISDGWGIYNYGNADIEVTRSSMMGTSAGSLGIGGRDATVAVSGVDVFRLDAGLTLENAAVSVERSRFADDRPCETLLGSAAIIARGTEPMHLADLFIDGVCGIGVLIAGDTAGEPFEDWSIQDIIAREIRSPPEYFGIGVSVGARLSGSIDRIIADDVDGPAVFLAGDEGKIAVSDVQVVRRPGLPSDTPFQLGIYAFGIPTYLKRIHVENAGHIGIWMLNVLDTTLTDVWVGGTRNTIEDDELAETSGIGVAVTTPPDRPQGAELKRLRLADQHWGLLAQETQGALTCSWISQSMVGIALFQGTDMLSIDDPDNYNRGNTVNIARDEREVDLPQPPAAPVP